jgi:hypothetical protein
MRGSYDHTEPGEVTPAPGRGRGLVSDPSTMSALRDAIQADMRYRLDELADRLEHDVECTERLEDLEQLLADAFSEVTQVFASGFAARLRESRNSSG